MNIHVASVSAFLPCAEAQCISPPAEIGAEKQDARRRIIVWDAEKIGRLDSLDADAEFDDDPEFQQGALHPSGISHDEWIPMGTRSKEGVIVPFSVQPPELGLVEGIADTDASGATQELLFTGREERVPDCVQRLVSLVNSLIIPSRLHFSFRTTRLPKNRLEAFRRLRK